MFCYLTQEAMIKQARGKMTNIDILLGKNIKKFRKIKKLSQEQMAELVDIERNSLSKIENGKCFVSSAVLEKIATALDVNTYELFLNDIDSPDDFIYYERLLENLKSDKIKSNPSAIKILYELTKEFMK